MAEVKISRIFLKVKPEKRPYKPLEVDFEIPKDIIVDIDRFIEYLNTGLNDLSEDCYRTEIDCDINWCKTHNELTPEQAGLLKQYYVHGGIYK